VETEAGRSAKIQSQVASGISGKKNQKPERRKTKINAYEFTKYDYE